MVASLAKSCALGVSCLASLVVFTAFTTVAFTTAAFTIAHADTADRDWRRVTSEMVPAERLMMVTDLGVGEAKSLMTELEIFDGLVDKYVAPFVPLARQIAPELVAQELQATEESRLHGERAALRLVIMRRRGDFKRYFTSGHFAAFTIPTLARTTLVVGPVVGRDSLRENLLHEYVHYRLRRDVSGGLPLWFEEGLASFLSQARFAPIDNQEVNSSESNQEAGSHLFELGFWNEAEGPPDMPLDELFALRDLRGVGRVRIQSFYRTAHALVRYIYLHSEIDKQQLAASLVLGKPKFLEQPGFDLRAAKKAISSLVPHDERWNSRHLNRGARPRSQEVLRGQFTVQSQSAEFAVEPMPANDVREIFADSSLQMNAPASERLYARVLKSEPDRLTAMRGYVRSLRFQLKVEKAAAVLAAAQAKQPEAWGLMLERSLLDTSGCIVERKPECAELWRDAVFNLRDVLDVQPDSFEAIYRLGLAHLYIGQPGESLGYLEIAWRRAPWSARVNYFLGENLRLVGDSRARWFLQNASRWAASEYFREVTRMALAEIDGASEQASEKRSEKRSEQ